MSVPVMACTVEVEDAVPNTVGSTPNFIANTNGVHTPPLPGAITVAQSPSGTSVTNTNRTLSGTAAFLGGMKVLGQWNGVRSPDNKFT